MTTDEKRVMSASMQKGSLYQQLYTLLIADRNLTEDVLARKLKVTPQDRRFVHAKTYLYEHLCHTLATTESDNDAYARQWQALMLVRQLYRHSRFELAREVLDKAIPEATELELFDILLPLLDLQRQLVAMESNSIRAQKTHQANIEQMDKAMAAYTNLQAYRRLHQQIEERLRTVALVNPHKDTEDPLLTHPLLASPDSALSYTALYLYYTINLLAHLHNGDVQKALAYGMELMDAQKDRISFSQAVPERYIDLMWNLMRVNYWAKRYEQNLDLIAQLDAYLASQRMLPSHLRIRALMTIHNTRMTSLSELGRWQEAMQYLPAIKQFVDTQREELPSQFYYMLHYNMADVYFFNGQHSLSLKMLNLVLEAGPKAVRRELYHYARLYRLMAFAHLGEWQVLEYEILNVKRHKLMRYPLDEFDHLILSWMQYCASQCTLPDAATRLSWQHQLAQLMAQKPTIVGLSYINLPKWLD